MLTLTGTIRAALTIGGGVNRKTGDAIPARPMLQIEGKDHRGLVQLYTLTVPDLAPFEGREGDSISVPVRAWAQGVSVNLAYEAGR
jgi:hypothetical protein